MRTAIVLATALAAVLPTSAQSSDVIRAKCEIAAEKALPRPEAVFDRIMHHERVERWVKNCMLASRKPTARERWGHRQRGHPQDVPWCLAVADQRWETAGTRYKG